MDYAHLPDRKRNRLTDYDYSSVGAYFVTICTDQKRCLLSNISYTTDYAPANVMLTRSGKVVDEQINRISEKYPDIIVEKYVIMPNHIHILFRIEHSSGKTISDVIRFFKSTSSREIHRQFGAVELWQRSFHDHIIRTEEEYKHIWEYIDGNPSKWKDDCYCVP